MYRELYVRGEEPVAVCFSSVSWYPTERNEDKTRSMQWNSVRAGRDSNQETSRQVTAVFVNFAFLEVLSSLTLTTQKREICDFQKSRAC
jgi:hypothetical protein